MNIINNSMLALKPLLYLCIGVSLSQFLQRMPASYIGKYDSNNNIRTNNRKPKLGDGCKHVFLDVGSNIGVHSRILYEPHLYPKPQLENGNFTDRFSSRKFFANRFGKEDERDNRNICIFAFEPNPLHIKRHKELERAYNALGWRYHFIHGGVGDTSSTITFYHIGKGPKNLERGFTMAKERCHKKCIPEEVMVYRLSDWIDNEIHDRIIPEDPAENDSPIVEPLVVMKMDIEMSEWIVLPDLITSGVLCRDIDTLLIEVHLLQHKNDYPIHFAQHNWTLGSNVEARKLKEGMFGLVRRNPSCKTELVQGDDEYYGSDGMPLPTDTTYRHKEMKDTPLSRSWLKQRAAK